MSRQVSRIDQMLSARPHDRAVCVIAVGNSLARYRFGYNKIALLVIAASDAAAAGKRYPARIAELRTKVDLPAQSAAQIGWEVN